MDTPDSAWVDIPSLRNISRQYDTAADLIDSATRQLTRLTFDGAVAGCQHADRGDALHTGLADLADQLRQWSRAAAEVAATLRASADRYVDADHRAAGRMD